MDFHALLGDTARKLQLDTSRLTPETRNFQLTLQGDIVITVELLPGDELVALSGLVCRFPDERSLPGLFAFLLEAHAYGIATDAAAFGIDQERAQVILFRNLVLEDQDGDKLLDAITRFVAVLKLWRDAYASGRVLDAARGELAATPRGTGAEEAARAAQPNFA
jgi:hypothetical protein